ncbi:helix-turn-helix domain-containing protein [Leuconostoc suionicum]|uniref:helix-turn-helix domain-containing protein n=1 Tax=Leuconostoc suionicum TaxID=1511761 RepID=UPI0024AE4783|nr:helix-turn-helix transcriptional regulator [Leuconostoc suionicum]MDI6522036.1 helix-turn-helix transcriptional regulator [Leuconostoc suionicum]MDI6550572.1 helix-turn-helix transcriptional regulator [Leuconostoc suionicum]
MQDIILDVKRKRGELNMSISELALLSGISRTTLSDIFNGKRKQASKTTLEKLNNWLLTEEKK